MAFIKTSEEIQKMREGGIVLSRALKAAVDLVRPGVLIGELDAAAEEIIRDGGGRPSFKGYKTPYNETPFPSTVCISINDEVVHGIASRPIVLQEGDIVGLDIGCWYKGLCTDMAVSVPVGMVSPEVMQLLKVTRASLFAGVQAAIAGKKISHISHAVQSVIDPHGYGIVRALVGHGVGHAVHEDPHVPNTDEGHLPDPKLLPGMCLALEPMITLGDYDVYTDDDGWTIRTCDGSPCAHFEVTIVITEKEAEIFTPLPI